MNNPTDVGELRRQQLGKLHALQMLMEKFPNDYFDFELRLIKTMINDVQVLMILLKKEDMERCNALWDRIQ